VGSVVGGRMSEGFGDDADFLKMICEAVRLAKDITKEQGRILAILTGVCCVAIALLIYLVVHIM